MTVYLITFHTYGTRLHGDPAGSVDRTHRVYGTPFVEPHRGRMAAMSALQLEQPALLADHQRTIVLHTLLASCGYRGWYLLAAHVRTNHVHALVAAPCAPEVVMGELKAYASRQLNHAVGAKRRWWARHGSTRHLWGPASIGAAVDYVISGQRDRMAWYCAGPEVLALFLETRRVAD